MVWSPINVGDGSIVHSAFRTDSGVFPLTGLLGSAITMHYVDLSSGTETIGTGEWDITDANTGLADYIPSSEEVANAGLYNVFPVIQLATGPKAFDAQRREIRPL